MKDWVRGYYAIVDLPAPAGDEGGVAAERALLSRGGAAGRGPAGGASLLPAAAREVARRGGDA